MTYTRPDLNVRPLSEMDGRADGTGDFRELGCAPVLGVLVSDYDCCSTEAWVVVGPSLGDDATLLVESVVASQSGPWGPVTWDVVDSIEAPSLADAVAATVELACDPLYRLGYRPCRSCEP